ncbi:unnamed protein product [Camellia sinensis]
MDEMNELTKLLGPNFKMKLPTYPQDRNQAIVVRVEGHSGIDTLLLCSNFCQSRPFGFSTLRAFHFFILLFIFIFIFFFILFISFFFSIYIYIYFVCFSALTFAWVSLLDFQPSEPLKGYFQFNLSMLIRCEISRLSIRTTATLDQ